MITVAIAEVFFFVEFNPLSALDRRRERLARRADADPLSRLHHPAFHLRLVALSVPRVLLFHRHRHRAAHRALAGRRDPERDPRESAARGGRRPQRPRLQAHRLRHRRRLCRASPAACSACMQAFMPPDAFMFDTSGQLVMQTAIGGVGTLFGPLLGAAVWLFLQDFLQATLGLGAAWKLVLGVDLRAAGLLPAPAASSAASRPLRLPDAPTSRAPSRHGAMPEPSASADARRSERRGSAVAAPVAACASATAAIRRPDPAGERPDQALRRRASPTATSTSPSTTASCAASSARTAPASRRSSRC